jgi:Ser/Thr protein kinase RdoA (MazF antagonist)
MAAWKEVLASYPADCQAERVDFLGTAGGLSGALLWRITSARGMLCLRRWTAQHPSAERLAFVHDVLRHVQRAGLSFVPAPLTTRRDTTFVAHGKHLWELAPWLPGAAADSAAANPTHLTAAMRALAEFHRAAATFPQCTPAAPSPGILQRRQRILRLMSGGLSELAGAVRRRSGRWIELADRGETILALFEQAGGAVFDSLEVPARTIVPLQPCLRDIHCEHVLFQGDVVTGIVDFGAMRLDNVAADIARLLGSWAANDADGWQRGLAAYVAVRPLSDDERLVVQAFDVSGVLLSGVQWLAWVFEEGRQFDDRPTILRRIDAILARLARLAELTRADFQRASWSPGFSLPVRG